MEEEMEGTGGGFESSLGLMGTYGDDNHDTLLPQFSQDQLQNQAHNLSPPMLLQDHNNPNKNKTIANPSGYFVDMNNNTDGGLGSSSSSSSASVKQKIMSHPYYNRLFAAYVSCQKIGAPPDAVARLEEIKASVAGMGGGSASIGEDPALDQFMEAYCEMLSKYEQELCKPFKEAMLSLSRIESQFKALATSSSNSVARMVEQESQMAISIGVTEASIGSSNWFGSEANKQLVHKPKKETLEAIRGHAIYGYGCCTSSS